MYKEALRPAWVEVNLTNLEYNIDRIQEKIGNREMIGVIKADAYGHGSVKFAEVLRKKGVKTFAVATLSEAITLREAGAKEEIIMLGLTPSMYADTIVDYDITAAVCEYENVKAFSEVAVRKGKTVKVILAVDTGMGRIGCYPQEAIGEATLINNSKHLKLAGMCTHFAVSDSIKNTDQLVRHIKSAMEEQQVGSKQITDALYAMNDSTVEVKSASAEMAEGNKHILTQINNLQNVTSMIKDSISEMSIGAQKINETGAALTGVSKEVTSSIESIKGEIDLFKV